MITFFRNLRIRFKLLGGQTIIFIIATLLGGSVIYYTVRSTIEANIESELTNSTAAILNMVRTAASTSIKNHLRAVAEKNKEIIQHIYADYENDLISEETAKKISKKILFSQTIGKTGYIFCANSKGIAVVHPNPGVMGKNFMDHGFVKDMIRLKQGYLEYDWKNPEDEKKRPKAQYMAYFEPWDWIIGVSSYREEFKELIEISDFKESILSLKFGKTGYAYITDSRGNLIVHPFLTGNYYNSQDKDGNYFVKKITQLKNGKLVYFWKNPQETVEREKMVIFNYIPEYDWIIASASYLDEIYMPLKIIRQIMLTIIFLIIALVFLTSFWVNNTVIKPLKFLMNRLSIGASGNFAIRMPVKSTDEIGQLADYFNEFMEKLEKYSTSLKSEIHQHQKSAKALQLSEEIFSKAFRSSPSGMLIAAMKDTKILNANDSFLKITGYNLSQLVGRELKTFKFFFNASEGRKVLQGIIRKNRLESLEFYFLNSKGDKRTGVTSVEVVDVGGEKCMLVAMEDITESRQLESEILDISEKERQKIAMELHDDLCPQLIGIEVLTKILKRKLETKATDEAKDADTIRTLILDSIDKTRRLSRGLFPVNLSEHGFDISLKELAGYISNVFGISCKLTCNSSHPFKESSVAVHLYYITHEAVHNAVKHAKADKIDIILTDNDKKISLTIKDNGKGLNNNTLSMGMGMKIMKYRATRIGASFDILENSEKGTLVVIELDKKL